MCVCVCVCMYVCVCVLQSYTWDLKNTLASKGKLQGVGCPELPF